MAFLQSAPPHQPFFRAPPVVLWLIGGLVALHLGRVSLPGGQADNAVYDYGLYPLRYSHAYLESHMANPGTLWERAIPFVSYLGLHAGWGHLIVNCFFLLAFGPMAARRFGAPLFLIFFVICGVASAVAYLALNWASPSPVIGASGAISGLMPAALRMLPGQAPWAVAEEAPLAPLLSRQMVVFTAVFVLANLLMGVAGIGPGEESGSIAWQAHLGGFAAGLLLCGPFDRLRPRAVGAPLDR